MFYPIVVSRIMLGQFDLTKDLLNVSEGFQAYFRHNIKIRLKPNLSFIIFLGSTPVF